MDLSNQSSPKPVIEIKGVQVIHDGTQALAIENLNVYSGDRVFVLGRSGSGKTTLSRLIKGRQEPTSGSVRVLGCDPFTSDPRESRKFQRMVAMIDQEFFLVPRLSVMGNILAGSLGRVSSWKSLIGWYPEAELEKAESILDEVDMNGLGQRRVETLSGGQRQRTAIARALMQEAPVILADEPVSNLDPELAEDALELLIECSSRRNETLIVNLHQPSLARKFATRIIGLSNRGEIQFEGRAEDFTEKDAEFLYQADNGSGGAK